MRPTTTYQGRITLYSMIIQCALDHLTSPKTVGQYRSNVPRCKGVKTHSTVNLDRDCWGLDGTTVTDTS